MKRLARILAPLLLLMGLICAQSYDYLPESLQQTMGVENESAEQNTYSVNPANDGGSHIFLSYEKAPALAYVGEIFPITLKAIITREDYERIAVNVLSNENFRILNPNSEWSLIAGEGYYTNTLYMQALRPAKSLPEIVLELISEDRVIEDGDLAERDMEILRVSGDARFSGVVAQSFALKSESTNRFDDRSLIVTLTLEATYSNLNSFRLKAYNGTVDAFDEQIALQSAEYDVIIPNHVQSLDFTYFNTISRDFQLVRVPLNIKSDDVSTHTDLNPKESKLKLIKNIAIAILAAALLIIFIIKRFKLALIAAVLCGVYLFSTNNPYNQIIIQPNATVRVLPTEKSSVFHITEGSLGAEKLMGKSGWVKVMLPSGRIGWVREEYVTNAKN
jgi:hypothetical protein